MQITTERTRLRRFQNSDLENMVLLETDPEVMRFTPMRVPQTREQIETRLSGLVRREAAQEPLGVWAAELADGGEFVGWFMLLKTEREFPELGFMLVRKFWGKGLATEISRALIEFAYSMGHQGIATVTDENNSASIHVLEKIGFQLVKKYSKHDPVLGREVEARYYEKRK